MESNKEYLYILNQRVGAIDKEKINECAMVIDFSRETGSEKNNVREKGQNFHQRAALYKCSILHYQCLLLIEKKQ